jgi:putative ABC transport system ATP-binding protein
MYSKMSLTLQNILPTYFEESRKQDSEIWGSQLEFSPGERIKIIAPSGSGKSSLINFLCGMRTNYSGDIVYDNKPIRAFGPEDWASLRQDKVSVVFQDLRLFPGLTVYQNIDIKRQLDPHHPAEKIREMAERLGIGHKLDSPGGQCSYGEQQRCAIIRALMQPFRYLLLDEPFSHLDDANAAKAMALMLEEAEARGACIILADLERIDHYPHTCLLHL